MYMTLEEVQEMNAIQLEIFKEFIYVCKILNLKYYMVHGSLLGSVRFGGFFPFDDDIDVAMPREDYNVFISEGQKYFDSKYFVQTYLSDPEYPLPFAKVRNSNTSFIQPVLNNLNINKGIYIDVFPIDNYPESRFTKLIINVKALLLNARISSKMNYPIKLSYKKKIIRVMTRIIIPSYRIAVKHKADLYCKVRKQEKVIVFGGKSLEQGIPNEWFGDGKVYMFENLNIVCPKFTEAYLNCIYGDYLTYDPSEKYMHGNVVEVSAEFVSCTVPYTEFKGVKT